MLHQAIDRVSPLIPADRTWIIGSEQQSEFLKPYEALIPSDQLLYEPVGKNTAPAIGWAAFEALKKDPDAIMVVLPSDHIIGNKDLFQETLSQAISLVEQEDCLCTLGIQPSHPHTGYGYIEVDQATDPQAQVLSFREKPDWSTAMTFIQEGRFFWNSGIFIWKAKTKKMTNRLSYLSF